MPKKFYFSSLVRRPMTLSGHVITFIISSISGGRAVGVYETENPDEISVLDAAVAGRRGVSEITQADFDLQKKTVNQTPSSSRFNDSPRLATPKITPELAVNAKAGVAVGKPAPAQETQFQGETHTNPSIASLLRVKRLSPPQPFAVSDAKVKKASARADRAKVRVARTSVVNP